MALIQKAFSDIITFSRSSNATRVGPTGLVEYAPHNLILQSQTFDNASWTKWQATIVANALAAPDGTVTADQITHTGASGNSSAYQAVTFTGIATASVYLKAGTATAGSIYIGAAYAIFNLSTGVVTTISTGSTASISSAGNGWYRCSITATLSGTFAVEFGHNNPGLVAYLWGAQLSVGPYALDYTPTTSAAVYGPRFDYDPVTLAARGLLVEEQRTNLLTYSEQFDNAAWSKVTLGGSVSVTANAGSSPDGTVNADLITVNRSNASTQYSVVVQATSLPSSTNYIGSIYLKAATSADVGKLVSLWQYDGTNVVNSVLVTLTDTWQRYTTLATSSLPSGGGREVISVGYITTASGGGTQTGSVSFLAWGAQAEAGSFATSYIPTLASTVTRSADVSSVNTLSPWFNATELSLYCEFDILSAVSGSVSAVSLDNGSANGYMFYKSASVTDYYAFAGSNFVKIGNLSSNATTKTALAYNASGGYGSMNGAATANIAAGSVTTPTQFLLGKDWAGSQLSGHLRRVSFYPRKLSSAELQALTA